MIIRAYQPQDADAIKSCIRTLHNYERQFDPDRKIGEDIADQYLEKLLQITRERNGRIFVALQEQTVTGYICVTIRQLDPLCFATALIGFISDLVVLPEYRNRGIGSGLIEAAEAYIGSCGIRTVRISVLDKNKKAYRIYKKKGYDSYQVVLTKQLG